MKKSFTVIVMALSVSGMLMSCGGGAKETPLAVKTAEESTADTISSKSVKKAEPLPFGFTPQEFRDNFSNFASSSDISADALQKITDSTFGFTAHSGAGSKVTIIMLSNSDGKALSINAGSDSISDNSFPDFAKIILSATGTSLNYNELDASLDFNSIPHTIDDFRICYSHGIEFSFSSTGFTLIRDDNTRDEYSYTKNDSNSKVAENTDIGSESQDSISEITLGQKNALSKALDYLDYTSFSYSGLIAQLEYEGFSEDEATYGADNCGADWKEQAAKKAQDYLDYTSFSRSGLIEQLEYEGFTKEQAEYGATAVGY